MISLLVSELLFVAAAVLGLRTLKTARAPVPVNLLAACALMAGLLYWQAELAGAHGLLVSAAGAGLLTAGLAVVFQLFKSMPIVAVLSNGIAALLMAPLFFISVENLQPVGVSTLAALHVALAIIGFAAFSLAAMQSVAVVWLSMQLKQHRLAEYAGAGSLEANEAAWLFLTRFAWLAVLLALLSGVPVVYDIGAQQLSHKIFFAILAWVLLSVVLLGRRLRGWRDRTAARWVFGGWLALVVAWFGTKWVLLLLAANAN